MNLPVEHYLRTWSCRLKTAQEKPLSAQKIEEISKLVDSLRELGPEIFLDTITENKSVSFVVTSSGVRIASITFDDEFA